MNTRRTPHQIETTSNKKTRKIYYPSQSEKTFHQKITNRKGEINKKGRTVT